MIIVEILITVAVAVGLVGAVLFWLTRPLWSTLARRVRIEREAERLKQLNARGLQAARENATAEVTEWMEKAGVGKLIGPDAGGLGGALNPALQAILERYPLDPRVVELANVYRQATGKELLPERLRHALEQPPETVAGKAAQPTAEERKVLEEARREVDGWLTLEQPTRRGAQEK